MLEKAVFFSEYNNINITGETSKSLTATLFHVTPLLKQRVSGSTAPYGTQMYAGM